MKDGVSRLECRSSTFGFAVGNLDNKDDSIVKRDSARTASRLSGVSGCLLGVRRSITSAVFAIADVLSNTLYWLALEAGQKLPLFIHQKQKQSVFGS